LCKMVPWIDSENDIILEENVNSGHFRYKGDSHSPIISIKKFRQLDGGYKHNVERVGDGSIITLFDKTPFPKNPQDVVCPHFLELKWANGCNYDCAWCYLNGTFRFRPMGKCPYMKDKEKVISHVGAFLDFVRIPSLLNSGELSDSLVFEGNGFAISENILPMFKEQKRHKILLLSKSDQIHKLLKSEAQGQTIASFTVNAFVVSKRWEKKAPSPKRRLTAAKKLSENGFQVRLRIDPVVPIKNWEKTYLELIDHVFSKLTPERITMGSLRGLQSTINHSDDKSWVAYLDDKSNWGKKVRFDKRKEMFETIIGYMESEYSFNNVGLCKETIEMWSALGMDYKKIRCNCIC
jgi:spore photoproduct lyase